MSRIQRSVIVALVLVAMPRLATAQTRDWDDLADDIARRVERQVDRDYPSGRAPGRSDGTAG